MSPDPQAAAASRQEVLEAENFIETYQVISEWIRFADAKAAVTLTVNGVLLGLLIPTLRPYFTDQAATHPTTWWPAAVLVLFFCWMLLLVQSAVFSFLCILPFRGQGRRLALDRTSHFHPAAIAKNYALESPESFLADCEQIGNAGFKREILTAILIDSHLSNSKYGYVTRSIWCLAGSVVFGFLYLMAIQF